MCVIFVDIFFCVLWIGEFIKNKYPEKKPHFIDCIEEHYKNTLLKDPGFLEAKKNIMNYSKGKTMAREERKPYSESPDYGRKASFMVTTNGPEFDEKGNIKWTHEGEIPEDIAKKIKEGLGNIQENFYKEDLNIFKKVNDMQFIDLNKQAQNEGIQNQNFAEIVYMLEEYISMLHNYPDQIHSVAEIQRKAIFEKFIILKK